MQIRIEVDVRPDELRRFFGLPDVAGLQEDFIQFLRTKLGQASENFDLSSFVRGNLKPLERGAALLRSFATGSGKERDLESHLPEAAEAAATKRAAPAKAARAVKAGKKSRAATKPAARRRKTSSSKKAGAGKQKGKAAPSPSGS